MSAPGSATYSKYWPPLVVSHHKRLNPTGLPVFFVQRWQDARSQHAQFHALEAGAFYVMDRGYLDFARLYALHQAEAFLVTRGKHNMNARRVHSQKTDRTTGVICDQAVALNGLYGPTLSWAPAKTP